VASPGDVLASDDIVLAELSVLFRYSDIDLAPFGRTTVALLAGIPRCNSNSVHRRE
jgi:hypothetical protein